jgi:O-antigen/teichoic acid export membrane protein
MLSSVTNALFGFVFWIIAARLYSTYAVGIAAAIVPAAALLEGLSGLGLSYGLVRFLKSSQNQVEFINSVLTLTGLLSLAVAGIFITGLRIWSPGLSILRDNPYYLVVFLLYVPMLVLDDLTDWVMVAGRQARFVLIHSLAFNILRLSLLVLLAVFLHSFGIFGSWSAATFVALMVSMFLLLPRAQSGYHIFFKMDRKAMPEVLRFSFLNYLGDLFWSMPSVVLPIIVLNLLGAKSNAYFYIAWMMSYILTMIPAAVAESLLAEGSYDQNRLKNNIWRSLKMIAIVLIPAVLLVWFLADKLLLFYGGQYAENGATLLRWLALATFPFAINIVYFTIKRIQKQVKQIIVLAASMAVIVVLTSYLLLPRLGINGVGIAWLAGQCTIALIVIVWDVRRWVRE